MKFTDKVKKAASKICAAVTGVAATAATTFTAWAADAGSSAGSSLTDQIMNSVQSGFTSAKDGIGQLLVIAIPVVIGVIVAVVLAKAAFGWIKTIGSKSK